MTFFRTSSVVGAFLLAAQICSAQSGGPPTNGQPANGTAPAVPIRQLSNVTRSDTTVIMGIAGVRHLPNGGVVVSDGRNRQIVVFDSTLRKFTVIADTSSKSENSYGFRSGGGLVPYIGDSTIFVDVESNAFLIIDNTGKIARVMAPVRASDVFYMGSTYYGLAGFDPKGRMIYRTYRPSPLSQVFGPMGGNGQPTITTDPDSAPLMRMDFDRRTVDTIGMIKIAVTKSVSISTPNMRMSYSAANPLPSNDEWTLLPDGTIAIVRTLDYHIDWLAPDGKMTATPRMPFDWKRLTAEDKVHMIDSVKKAEADRVAKNPPSAPPPGMPTINRPFVTVEPNELPDFYPPVRSGQVRSDYDGNVWILPSTSKEAKDGLLYDVVNRKGEIMERVQLPKDRTLVGFGPHGLIYMHHVISPTRAAIERAYVTRPRVE